MSEQIVTNPGKIAENWRVAMSALLNLFLTMHRVMAEAIPVGPTESLIYATVAAANVQKLMRERTIPEQLAGTEVLPREWVVPISRNAIATTTGLPRETVRRHITRMIEDGLLAEDPRGGIVLPIGIIRDRGMEPILDALMTEFARSTERLLRIGAIQVQPE